MMTHRERFLTALRNETPDKVPMFDLEFNEASIINIGRYFSDDLPPIKQMIDYSVEETKRYPAAISDPARMAKNFQPTMRNQRWQCARQRSAR